MVDAASAFASILALIVSIVALLVTCGVAIRTSRSIKFERQRAHDLTVLTQLLQLTNRSHTLGRENAWWSGYAYLRSLSQLPESPLTWTERYFAPDQKRLDQAINEVRNESWFKEAGDLILTEVEWSADPGEGGEQRARSVQNLIFWELIDAVAEVSDAPTGKPRMRRGR